MSNIFLQSSKSISSSVFDAIGIKNVFQIVPEEKAGLFFHFLDEKVEIHQKRSIGGPMVKRRPT